MKHAGDPVHGSQQSHTNITTIEPRKWDHQYREEGALWGYAPSVLGKITVEFFKNNLLIPQNPRIIDIGCGYGRDVLYFQRERIGTVVGIDTSRTAIEQATRVIQEERLDHIEFRCVHYKDISNERFDIVYLSNVYQILHRPERDELRSSIEQLLKPKGYVFMSTLSVDDPQHAGKGIVVPGEQNSFIEPERNVYLHFCMKEELLTDFQFLNILQLYPLDYEEQRVGGTHHHISWILIASHK